MLVERITPCLFRLRSIRDLTLRPGPHSPPMICPRMIGTYESVLTLLFSYVILKVSFTSYNKLRHLAISRSPNYPVGNIKTNPMVPRNTLYFRPHVDPESVYSLGNWRSSWLPFDPAKTPPNHRTGVCRRQTHNDECT